MVTDLHERISSKRCRGMNSSVTANYVNDSPLPSVEPDHGECPIKDTIEKTVVVYVNPVGGGVVDHLR